MRAHAYLTSVPNRIKPIKGKIYRRCLDELNARKDSEIRKNSVVIYRCDGDNHRPLFDWRMHERVALLQPYE